MPSSPSSPSSSSSDASSDASQSSSSVDAVSDLLHAANTVTRTGAIPAVLAADLIQKVSSLVEAAMPAIERAPPKLKERLWRESDRLITPVSISVLIIVLGGIVATIAILCVHERDLGHDYTWLINDATKIIGGLCTVITTILVAALRPQTARIERNTGTTQH